MNDALRIADPSVYGALQGELTRERETLVLIASENYASRAVLEAQGSVLTNKYAEGYPEARYYGGCAFADVLETLAIERAKRLFGAEYANVQPHSGSQANMAVCLATLRAGDVLMGMKLSHGGHLTHGSPANYSGTLYRALSYGLDPVSERIDMDQVRDLARKERPRMIIAGASAYPRTIDFEGFRDIARDVGAFFMVDMAHIAGLVAVGLHPSPVGVADFVTATTHKTLRGPRGGLILADRRFAPLLQKGVFPGIQGGPLMHVIAAKAVGFGEALSPDFRGYQEQVLANAGALAEELLGFGFALVTGGTDNHLLLMDLSDRDITGAEAERALGECGIVVNKNTVPSEKRGPRVTSGLRLGTPAATTRGMKEKEMRFLAGVIKRVLDAPRSTSVLEKARRDVFDLCKAFPLYEALS